MQNSFIAITSRAVRIGSFALVLLAFMVVVPAAWAQGGPQPAPQPAPQQAPQAEDVEVSDQELDAIAKAYIDVQNVLAEYEARLAEIQDPERAVELQQQLTADANAVIEARGVEVVRFDQVLQAARVDTELQQRLVSHLEELISENG